MTALILPYCNTAMMLLLLQQVAKDFSQYFVLMLVDKAAWHTPEKLEIPENIRLIPQLAGSPELNPTEHIWEDI